MTGSHSGHQQQHKSSGPFRRMPLLVINGSVFLVKMD